MREEKKEETVGFGGTDNTDNAWLQRIKELDIFIITLFLIYGI
jgi:hypothetical protein